MAANVLAHGVGGLNIDASRVSGEGLKASDYDDSKRSAPKFSGILNGGKEGQYRGGDGVVPPGRFPANVLLDEHAAEEMDRQSGWQKDGVTVRRNIPAEGKDANPNGIYSSHVRPAAPDFSYGGGGGASRFFPVFKYQAKAPKRERPVIEREDGSKVQHPTVKPLALMEWLVTLITPEGGAVLDPFAGTGTTLQAARDKGFKAIGVEQDTDYIQLIHTRLENSEETLFATTN